MADQDINRNININVTENASATLEQIARAWQELTRRAEEAGAVVNQLSDEFDRRFKPTATGAFQDVDNQMRFATDQARQLQQQIEQATQAAKILAEQEAGLRARGRQMQAASPYEANRVGQQLQSERTVFGRIRTNEEIESERIAHQAAIERMRVEALEAQQQQRLAVTTQTTSERIAELRENLQALQLMQQAGMGDNIQAMQRMREELRSLGAGTGASRADRERVALSQDYPSLNAGDAERRATKAYEQFQANQRLRQQATVQEALDLDRITTAQQQAAAQQAEADARRSQQSVFNRQKEVDAAVAALNKEVAATQQAAERQAEIDTRRVRQAEQQYERLEAAYMRAQATAQQAAERAAAAPGVGTARSASTAASAEEAAARRLREQATRVADQQAEVQVDAYIRMREAEQAYAERVRLDDATLEASAERVARARVEATTAAYTRSSQAATESAERQVRADQMGVESAERAAQQRVRYYQMQDEAHAATLRRQQERENRYSLGGQFGHALINTALYTTAFGLIMQVQNAATELVGAMFQKPAEAESAIVLYTRYLGNAQDAQKRFNAVMQESTQIGIPAKDILELDQRLAQLGVTSETSQRRFGRSLEQVRQDLEDLSALPGLEPKQVEEFFTRAADGANRLLLALKSAGITTEQELRGLGVRMNQQGTQILSDNNTTTRALLSVIERHYSGLAEATGKTAQGMQVRWANTWDQIARTFGEKSGIFKEVEDRQREMLDSLSSPEALDGIGKMAQNFGDAVTLILIGWDTITKAVRDFNQEAEKAGSFLNIFMQGTGLSTGLLQNARHPGDPDLSKGLHAGEAGSQVDDLHSKILAYEQAMHGATNATDAFGQSAPADFSAAEEAAAVLQQAIDSLKSSLDDLNEAMSRSRAAEADILYPLEQASRTISNAQKAADKGFDAMLKPMEDHMKLLQQGAKEAQAGYESALAPLQQHLSDLGRASQDLRQHYDDLIAPLKRQEEQLQRNYELQKQARDLASLDDKIARARLMSVDIYSSQGRAAAESLPDLLRQRADMQAEQQYQRERNALEDRVKGLERERDLKQRGIEAEQRSTQDQIQAVQAAQKASASSYEKEIAAWQAQIDAIKERKEQMHDAFQEMLDGLEAQQQKIKDQFELEQRNIQRQIRATEDAIKALEKAMKDAETAASTLLQTTLTYWKTVFDKIKPDSDPFQWEPGTPNRQPGVAPAAPVTPPARTGASTQGATTRREQVSNNAAQARGQQAQLGDRQTINLNITGLDNMGNKQFQELVEVNRDQIMRQVAVSIRSNRK